MKFLFLFFALLIVTPSYAGAPGTDDSIKVDQTQYWEYAVHYEVERIKLQRLAPNEAALEDWKQNPNSEYRQLRLFRNQALLRAIIEAYDLDPKEDSTEIRKIFQNEYRHVYREAIKQLYTK